MGKDIDPGFIILVARNEQLPYSFEGLIPRDQVRDATLKTGDYQLEGFHETGITIERKRGEELFSTCGKGRERFVRELERMRAFQERHLVVEATLSDLTVQPRHVERVVPATVINSLVSWSHEYGIHVWFGGTRRLTEFLAFRILYKFWGTSGHAPKEAQGKQSDGKRPGRGTDSEEQ